MINMKHVAIGSVSVLALIIGAMSANIVEDGTVEVPMFAGTVASEPLKPGFGFYNPLNSYSVWSTRDMKLKFDGLQVPAQDKFKTSVDIEVMVKFDGDKAPLNRINGGSTQTQAIEKYVNTKLTSTVREFGKGLRNSQDLFRADVQSNLQTSIMNEVNEYSKPFGYTVTEVFIQDIELDPVIKRQITNTKEREEKVNQAQADLDRIAKEAQQGVERAKADRSSAEEKAKADERRAEAEAYAARQLADAKLYAAQKEADANNALRPTITQELVNWRKLDIEQIRANKYQGGVPQTVVGSEYQGGLLMDIRK